MRRNVDLTYIVMDNQVYGLTTGQVSPPSVKGMNDVLPPEVSKWHFLEQKARDVLESVNAFHPLGRHGYPADVVEAILFLAGDRAGWITGTTLPIDGGVLAGRNAPPAPVRDESRA